MKRANLLNLIVLNAYWFGLSFMWNSLHVIILPAVLLNFVPETLKNTYLGLMTFMAGVGLRAGSGIIETFAQSGLSLVLAGVAVTTLPVALGYLFGRRVLALNPVLLLGAITGSMTSGASLSIVTGQARSAVPSLGYTGAYAFANVFLTVAGSVILLI